MRVNSAKLCAAALLLLASPSEALTTASSYSFASAGFLFGINGTGNQRPDLPAYFHQSTAGTSSVLMENGILSHAKAWAQPGAVKLDLRVWETEPLSGYFVPDVYGAAASAGWKDSISVSDSNVKYVDFEFLFDFSKSTSVGSSNCGWENYCSISVGIRTGVSFLNFPGYYYEDGIPGAFDANDIEYAYDYEYLRHYDPFFSNPLIEGENKVAWKSDDRTGQLTPRGTQQSGYETIVQRFEVGPGGVVPFGVAVRCAIANGGGNYGGEAYLAYGIHSCDVGNSFYFKAARAFGADGQAISGVSFSAASGFDYNRPSPLLNISGAVPEPSTWLNLLSGFAMVGSILRARRGRRSGQLTT